MYIQPRLSTADAALLMPSSRPRRAAPSTSSIYESSLFSTRTSTAKKNSHHNTCNGPQSQRVLNEMRRRRIEMEEKESYTQQTGHFLDSLPQPHRNKITKQSHLQKKSQRDSRLKPKRRAQPQRIENMRNDFSDLQIKAHRRKNNTDAIQDILAVETDDESNGSDDEIIFVCTRKPSSNPAVKELKGLNPKKNAERRESVEDEIQVQEELTIDEIIKRRIQDAERNGEIICL